MTSDLDVKQLIVGTPLFMERDFPMISFYPLFYTGMLMYKMKFDRVTAIRHTLIIVSLFFQYSIFFSSKGRSDYLDRETYGLILIGYATVFFLFIDGRLNIANRVTIFLGKISYSLYLIHQFLCINIIIPGLMKYAHLSFWVAAFGIAMPIAIIAATLITTHIEKPIMDLIRSIYRNQKSGVAIRN